MPRKKRTHVGRMPSRAEKALIRQINMTEEERDAAREKEKIRQRIRRTGSAVLVPKEERPIVNQTDSGASYAQRRRANMSEEELAAMREKEKIRQRIRRTGSAELKPKPPPKNPAKAQAIATKKESAEPPSRGQKRKASSDRGPKAKKKTAKKKISIKLKIRSPQKNPKKAPTKTSQKSAIGKRN